jgi:hypothetical protein
MLEGRGRSQNSKLCSTHDCVQCTALEPRLTIELNYIIYSARMSPRHEFKGHEQGAQTAGPRPPQVRLQPVRLLHWAPLDHAYSHTMDARRR